jgi:four helix bundle protein
MMQITDLEVWKSSMDLAKSLYELSRSFPEKDSNGLGFLLRRTVTSLPANIAAAASRKYGKESLQYLQKAKGYVYELETQVYLAERLGFIDQEQLQAALEQIDTARKLLFGFIKHYKRTSQQ